MFARHDLVWLTDAGWRQAQACVGNDAGTPIAAWRKAGWPATVRRADADLAPGQVALGIALPPDADGQKVRIAFRVDADADAVARRQQPMPLAQVIAAVPRWRAALAGLERQAAQQGLEIGVYGSVALQAVTGQTYLTDASDIDVLLQPRCRAGLDAGLALLAAHVAVLPLDGEIVFPGGRAVAWKELSAALNGAAGARVLVKDTQRVALVKTDDLIDTLQEEACKN